MRSVLGKLWPVAVFVLFWAMVVRAFDMPAYILPSPEDVVTRLHTSSALLAKHAAASMVAIFGGFLAASISGFVLGVVIVHSRWMELILEPFVVVSQVIPKVALAPLFIIWFGHGVEPKVIIAGLIAFFPVLVNTVLGLKSVDREIIDLMDSIAATRRQIFFHVRLPNSLPYILPSLKVATLLSVVGAMVGEFVGANKGLGYLMILGNVNLDTELLFAALAVVTAIGLVLYGSIGVLERMVSRRYGIGSATQIITA